MTNDDNLTRLDVEMTIEHAAEHGTERDLLVALRRRLVAALEDKRTQPRDLSPVVLRLREIAAALNAHDEREAQEATEAPDEPFNPEDL